MGTRFLPATKAQPKEMLLVVDRPVIQYVVEEGLASGADEVVIVNSRDKKSIEKHFSPDPELVATLRARGKDAYADEVERVGNLRTSRWAWAMRFTARLRKPQMSRSLYFWATSSCPTTTFARACSRFLAHTAARV